MRTLLTLSLLVAVMPVLANETVTTVCPRSIQTDPSGSVVNAGETVPDQAPGIHRLVTASVYAGPIEQQGRLAPDEESAGQVVWRVGDDQEHWLECHYADTPVRVTRPLPAKTTSCRLAYREPGGRFVLGRSEVVFMQCIGVPVSPH